VLLLDIYKTPLDVYHTILGVNQTLLLSLYHGTAAEFIPDTAGFTPVNSVVNFSKKKFTNRLPEKSRRQAPTFAIVDILID